MENYEISFNVAGEAFCADVSVPKAASRLDAHQLFVRAANEEFGSTGRNFVIVKTDREYGEKGGLFQMYLMQDSSVIAESYMEAYLS